ncbi:DUF3219 family protein [Mammaliicoccus fleurettii]|uniref:DUF3219 family protein n=1 Tax=Mammaliicoccus fleurettii TaxID=150056 RepID=UPI002DBF3335|nr:DUF3219 family protein [Mammaliicoccus fleurettii]MEB8068555.1 YkvR family protein [Mammaliicoccus fleurettii]
MIKEIYIDDTRVQLTHFEDEVDQGLYKISIEFDVTSETYHDIAVLLYREEFDINIPEKNKRFKAKIFNYATSLTNLYESDQVAQYRLILVEIPEETKE